MLPDLSLARWLLGMVCAFSIGLAKTGMPGFGILAIPLMLFTVGDARQSAGWLLPIMCTADVFAILYWRRHAAASRLFSLAPWVLTGMAGGALALAMKERILRRVVGGCVLTMLTLFLARRLRPQAFASPAHPAPYGLLAGFASTVANAAGPVMNLYLLSKRLPKEEFLATGAWFFFVMNLAKVPIYAGHGLISGRSLAFDAVMIPATLTGAFAGRWLALRIPTYVFEWVVIAFTAAATFLLFR